MGDKIGILSITLVEYDDNFKNSFDLCAEETHKEGLNWAHEPSACMPLNLIASGIEKVRASLDFPTFMKSFYFWKTLTKKENQPLPPIKHILPTQYSCWNLTKHRSDAKTQCTQSKKISIPNNNLGAKAFDRMLMIAFSEVH